MPVLKDSQRRLLKEAQRLARVGAMIPPDRNYAERKRVYEEQTKAAGLDHMRGLRHAYALDCYEDLTGSKAPAAGGPARGELKGERVGTAHRLRGAHAADCAVERHAVPIKARSSGGLGRG